MNMHPFVRRAAGAMTALLLAAGIFAGTEVSAEASAPAGLQITEACGDNEALWTLDFQDYLELCNSGSEPLRLSDFSLRVKKKAIPLPDVTLDPGAYYVLICDGEEYPKLSKSGFTATLLDSRGEAVDSITVGDCSNQVWLRDQGLGIVASPGYPNTDEGVRRFRAETRGSLIISEVLSSNYTAAPTRERGADVLELYNCGSSALRLSDYCLSDDRDDLTRFRLPAVTLQPGQCFTLLCTKDSGSERATGFKLSSDGETVYLSTADGQVTDALTFPALPTDVTYGWADDHPGYLAQPSPGKPNTGAVCSSIAAAPRLSLASCGGLTEPVTVTISGEGPFYYTTDGNDPTAASTLYQAPITIDGSTTLRVIAAPQGQLPSQVVTAVYRFDTADYTLPSVFITLDRQNLVNREYGLLNNPEDKDLEAPASITFLEADGTLLFSENCGFSIAGQTSRVRPNRGWKVTFRDQYGKDNAGVQVFPGLDVTGFDSFVFRLGTTGQPIHDILATAIGEGTMEDVLYQHYRPVNLFIGEAYYGVFYMREHVNANFVANHLGGDEDSVDIVYNISDAKEGSSDDWQALMDYCRTHDLSVQAHYDYVAARLNIDSFIDYFIWRPYTGDSDHPNIRYVRSRDSLDSRWHIIIYDMDWAFQKKDVSLNKYTYQLYEEEKHNNLIIFSLLKNEQFRQAFLERLSRHMHTTFDPVRVNALLDALTAETAHDMAHHQKRWNSTMGAWEQTLEKIRSFISAGSYDRRTVLLRETQKFFSLTDEEMETWFSGLPY